MSFFEYIVGMLYVNHSNVVVVVGYVCIIHYGDILWNFIQIMSVKCM